MTTYRKKLIKAALPLETAHEMFDNSVVLCDTTFISPLFLREQGARRPTAASAFLTSVYEKISQVGR